MSDFEIRQLGADAAEVITMDAEGVTSTRFTVEPVIDAGLNITDGEYAHLHTLWQWLADNDRFRGALESAFLQFDMRPPGDESFVREEILDLCTFFGELRGNSLWTAEAESLLAKFSAVKLDGDEA
ncbi:hypothetical protein [Streptomyces atratus]|uniref:hypothetical protein n=1 Tax=Streptomyces atratus TaxID=1893 RepID=UPI003667016E